MRCLKKSPNLIVHPITAVGYPACSAWISPHAPNGRNRRGWPHIPGHPELLGIVLGTLRAHNEGQRVRLTHRKRLVYLKLHGQGHLRKRSITKRRYNKGVDGNDRVGKSVLHKLDMANKYDSSKYCDSMAKLQEEVKRLADNKIR